MTSGAAISDFGYATPDGAHTDAYLIPPLRAALDRHKAGKRLFELGCGNGTTAAVLTDRGFAVTGIDPSPTGIALAQTTAPRARLEQGSSDEDLAARFGQFDTVVSLEVAEHVYAPARYARAINALLAPGGLAVVSTPYHSYLKNLALAVTGKLDGHFTALWEGGHIKFWSRATLRTLFDEAGFDEVDFVRVGRIPLLAKSMVAVYRKRADV